MQNKTSTASMAHCACCSISRVQKWQVSRNCSYWELYRQW